MGLKQGDYRHSAWYAVAIDLFSVSLLLGLAVSRLILYFDLDYTLVMLVVAALSPLLVTMPLVVMRSVQTHNARTLFALLGWLLGTVAVYPATMVGMHLIAPLIGLVAVVVISGYRLAHRTGGLTPFVSLAALAASCWLFIGVYRGVTAYTDLPLEPFLVAENAVFVAILTAWILDRSLRHAETPEPGRTTPAFRDG